MWAINRGRRGLVVRTIDVPLSSICPVSELTALPAWWPTYVYHSSLIGLRLDSG
jgi:hypothetical protein